MDTHARSIEPQSYTVGPLDRRAGALRSDVEVRLRRVCADMPPETFDSVVSELVAFRLRWELREPCW